MEYLSKQRYDEIASELKNLIEVVYPKIKDDLAEASAQGDRSDNAGYREARRNQAKPGEDHQPYTLPAEDPGEFTRD